MYVDNFQPTEINILCGNLPWGPKANLGGGGGAWPSWSPWFKQRRIMYTYLKKCPDSNIYRAKHLGKINLTSLDLLFFYRKELSEVGFSFESDFDQVGSFLHENGILLHYDDISPLNDLYFVDPQWLCKMVSRIITIRIKNPYYNKGIYISKI